VKPSPNVEPKLPTARGHEAATTGRPCPVPVAEGYERWASIYDHAPNPLLAREERHLLPLFVDLRNKRILDLACGTGRWLERLMAQGAESGVGIDCSAAMLRVAGKKDAIKGRLARAACESLPFCTAVFDLAICSFALGHITDLESMVRELARVTKPGADVFVSDLHPEAYARGWRVGFRDDSTAVQIEMLPRVAEEIVQAFHSNGFECLAHVSLCLGDPEKPIFVRAGKVHSFAEACRLPAVLVCHFRRLDFADQLPGRVMKTLKTSFSTRSSLAQSVEVRP
jgi:ubiquinone/menaquinone biosynthesis C-methylase UbiE